MARKNILKLTFGLIVVNLLLASFAVFNFYSAKIDIAKVVNQSNQVLGANTNIPTFDKNFIISDQTFSSTRVFDTEAKVQSYLESVNSPLRNLTDQGKRASYWIFSSARGQTSSKWGVVPNLNPGLILAYLEKEQSLLSLRNYDTAKDPENRIRTAMGYGCPDTAACATEYFGFANQVNWAAYQLQFNFNLAASGNSLVAPYIVNRTITTLDEYNVFLTNAATAANYRYTPHVYWGNYNLWAIMVSNGWGVDSATYSKADLDAKNLVNKDIVAFVEAPNVSFEQVKNALSSNYQIGQVGENIKLIQTFLRQEGYYMSREITGMYGVVTDQALKNYRRDNSLGITSKDNADRCKALIGAKYTIGDISEDIKALQQCLRTIGLFNWPSNTGYFGPITLAAQTQALASTQSPTEIKQEKVLPKTSDNSCASLRTQSFTLGETSNRVKILQGCMRAIGLFSFPSDTGYFGPVTRASLNSWIAQGQAVNSNNTVSVQSPANSAKTASCDELKQKTYKIGDTGNEVIQLQQCLRTAGVFNWPSNTGYFGPVTAEALAKQRGLSLPQFSCSDLKAQTWTFGETSNRVKLLQDCMSSAGTFKHAGGSTSYFGEVTKAALISWRGYL